MKRISSFRTVFSRRLIPVGLIGAFGIGAVSSTFSGTPLIEAFVGFCGAAIFILLLQRVLISDLADDVVDLGDSLLVRRGKVKDRISLANLKNITESCAVSPSRMTLYFVEPTAFGKSVAFTPASSRNFNPLAKHSLAEELMLRSKNAREKNSA